MALIDTRNFYRAMCAFTSATISLFSSLLLVIPNGTSVGPLLLFIGSTALLISFSKINFRKEDWLFIGLLVAYFLAMASLNFIHELPSSAYDYPSRYILAIPVYLLLLAYPPKEVYFWWGLIVGGLGAGILALYQFYFVDISVFGGRSSGFLNPIQFGDIALLLVGILLCGLIWLPKGNKVFVVSCVFSSLLALLASFLSLTRGGWIAIPFILCFFVVCGSISIKRKILAASLIFFFISVGVFVLLPSTNHVKVRVLDTKQEVINAFTGKERPDALYTINSRLLMWQSGLMAFKESPVLGGGNINNIKARFPEQWRILNSEAIYTHLHSEYIDALAKKGLVGFTALMAMYLIPLYYFIGLVRTRQTDVMPFAAAGVVLILCLMVFGLTQCFLAHNSGTMVFVFYLVIIKAYCRNIVAARSMANSDDGI